MSLNAPATFTISGDSAITITVTWGTKPADSTISHASFTQGTVSATTYNMNDVFDNTARLLKDLSVVATTCTNRQAEVLLRLLQDIVERYNLQANQTTNLRFNIAIA
jgi:hypothetical protein